MSITRISIKKPKLSPTSKSSSKLVNTNEDAKSSQQSKDLIEIACESYHKKLISGSYDLIVNMQMKIGNSKGPKVKLPVFDKDQILKLYSDGLPKVYSMIKKCLLEEPIEVELETMVLKVNTNLIEVQVLSAKSSIYDTLSLSSPNFSDEPYTMDHGGLVKLAKNMTLVKMKGIIEVTTTRGSSSFSKADKYRHEEHMIKTSTSSIDRILASLIVKNDRPVKYLD